MGCGQTTWKTEIRALEADLSYYFDPEKVRVAKEALARKSMDPADYPRPDLAIEIDMSPPQVDRPAIYKDLGVTEVWRLVKGQELIIEQLQGDGTYAPIEQSRFLRIRGEDVVRWLNEAATDAPGRLEPSPQSMGDGIGRAGLTDKAAAVCASRGITQVRLESLSLFVAGVIDQDKRFQFIFH